MKTVLPCALVIASDRAAAGSRRDETAGALVAPLAALGFVLEAVDVVPDERAAISVALRARARAFPLVLTSGGTGVGPRDVTPEATRDVLDLEVPGVGEAMRAASLLQTPYAMGSRALAGFVGPALVVNLPGRPSGAVECLSFVGASLRHLIAVRSGPVADRTHGEADLPGRADLPPPT